MYIVGISKASFLTAVWRLGRRVERALRGQHTFVGGGVLIGGLEMGDRQIVQGIEGGVSGKDLPCQGWGWYCAYLSGDWCVACTLYDGTVEGID